MQLRFEFQYEATGKTDTDETFTRKGNTQCGREFDPDNDYIDNGLIYSEAFSSVMDDIWTFCIEKKGHTDISEISIQIKGLKTL